MLCIRWNTETCRFAVGGGRPPRPQKPGTPARPREGRRPREGHVRARGTDDDTDGLREIVVTARRRAEDPRIRAAPNAPPGAGPDIYR